MRANAVYILGVTVIVALLLSACGGRSGSVPTTELPDLTAVIGDLAAALPALPPGGDFNPHKMSSEVTAGHTGDQAFDHSAPTVTLAGAQAEFHPGAGELGWAIYEFAGSPADEIAHVGFVTSLREPGALVYVAISNYSAGTWEHLGPRNQDAGEIVPAGGEGDYASENGHTYVAIFAFDEDMYNIDFVRLTYANRYPVSGQVVDRSGAGIPNCLITTSIGPGGGGIMTAADGTFTLPAVPDGSWHLMATKPGLVFYNNPEVITVSGGPLTGVQVIGEKNLSHFDPIESHEPNDTWWEAPVMDLATPVIDFISASDDPDDFYRFEFTVPGQYYFRMLGDPTIMFPYVEVYNEHGYLIENSTWVYNGTVYVGFAVAAPRTIYMHASCSGGGGEYQVQLGNGNLNSIGGDVTNGGGLGYVKVRLQAGSDLTDLYTSTVGNYSVKFVQPVSTTVTPDPDGEDAYTYTPVNAVVDLSLGDDPNVDFSGTGLFAIDTYEPNDTDLTANEFALPLTSHDPMKIGAGDNQDWYKFKPAAGQRIIVNCDFDYTENTGLPPISMYLHSSTETYIGYSFKTDTGLELRLEGENDTDGDYYFLEMSCWSHRTFPYALTIEEYTGYTVEVGALWVGESNSYGLEGARIDVFNPGQDWLQSFVTAHSGLTEMGIELMDGEELFVELFRYGVTCDRYTQHLTVSGEDQTYWFRCNWDECDDAWESNNLYGKYVDYPMDFDATLSGDSDYVDKYIFTPASTDPLHVQISSPDNDRYFTLNLIERSTETLIVWREWHGDFDALLPTVGTVEHILEIASYDGDGSYHVSADETEGYMLSGTVLDTVMAPVPNAYVYCPAIGEVWQSGSWSPESNYELGPFAPGSYQIYIYGANWASSPASPWTLDITSSDVVQNFEFSWNYTDANEPNNDTGTATPLASGAVVAGNMDSDSDNMDWYSVTVGGPTMISSTVLYEKWRGDPYLTLYHTDGSTTLDYSWTVDIGQQRVDYLLPGAGTYYLRIYASGANYYTIVADY